MSLIAWLDTLQSPEDAPRLPPGLPPRLSPATTACAVPTETRSGSTRTSCGLSGRRAVRAATQLEPLLRPARALLRLERAPRRTAFGVHALRERAAIGRPLGSAARHARARGLPRPRRLQELLAARIGPSGKLAELDLSIGMLRACARRARKNGLDPLLVQANAAYLPFADDCFDAVFHFGGVKLFSEPQRALAEFVRVARPGAVVAWGDEGFGAGAPTGFRRRLLQRMNPGFLEPCHAARRLGRRRSRGGRHRGGGGWHKRCRREHVWRGGPRGHERLRLAGRGPQSGDRLPAATR